MRDTFSDESFVNTTSHLRLSVLVPTYRRVDDLKRCLAALAAQRRPADEIIVVVRDTDRETLESLEASGHDLRIVAVTKPGQVAALNRGLDAVCGDVVAITDDDAAPHQDWLERIERHFLNDRTVGGVGGRDYVAGEPPNQEQHVVGKLYWYGRMVGNHHLGVGGPRDVDFLKGANMSYRTAALCEDHFDVRLRGSGAQVHNELGIGFVLSRRGWRLLYDPAVAVDHYPSVRHDADQRGATGKQSMEDRCYNAAISLTEHLSWHGRIAYLIYSISVGSRARPGLLQCLRLMVIERSSLWGLLIPAWRGHMSGWWDALHNRAQGSRG